MAIILFGRTNVGKSTLFNRLVERAKKADIALVAETPHLTRDVRQGQWRIGESAYALLDVAGWETQDKSSLAGNIRAQSQAALQQAELIIFVCDMRSGLLPEDEALAKFLRQQDTPLFLVANKCDSKQAQNNVAELHRLGLGAPIEVSALHGSGLEELTALAETKLKPAPLVADEKETTRPLNLAIIGCPNVGKSSLVNVLAGAQQLVEDEAGTTRESNHIAWQWDSRAIALYDTPGLKRKKQKDDALSRAHALGAVQFAELVVLVLDATEGVRKQDIQLAELVEQEGRGLVVALNKMDIASKADLPDITHRLHEKLSALAGVPICPISAQKRTGLKALMSAVIKQEQHWNATLSTGVLNRWLQKAQEKHEAPLQKQGGRVRPTRLRYMTQTRTRPPRFAIFGNIARLPESYLRYLRNDMRQNFGLDGIPLRLEIKRSANPFTGKK